MSSNLKIRPVDDIDRKNLKICGGEPSKAEVHKQKFTWKLSLVQTVLGKSCVGERHAQVHVSIKISQVCTALGRYVGKNNSTQPL